jgi:hypothetical protein
MTLTSDRRLLATLLYINLYIYLLERAIRSTLFKHLTVSFYFLSVQGGRYHSPVSLYVTLYKTALPVAQNVTSTNQTALC